MLHTALLQLNTLSVFDVAQSTVTAEHCQCTMLHRAPLQLNALSVNTLSVYDAAQSTVTAEHTVDVCLLLLGQEWLGSLQRHPQHQL